LNNIPAEPVIWTWKGNLPLSAIEHFIEWTRTPEMTRFREVYMHDGMQVRERIYTKDNATGQMLGQVQGDALDAHPDALIFTSKGNVPITTLTHSVEMVDSEIDTALNDIYRDASGEIVKKSAYVHGKKGLEMGAQQAVLA
jgi:hypothetical protein